MTIETVSVLAQKEDGWGQLLYLLIFLVFPMLNKFGEKIRNWAADREEAKRAGDADPSKKPKGIAARIQPATPVVLRGERAALPGRRSPVQTMVPLPVARAQRTVGDADRRTPMSPSRPPSPVKARRVRPKQRTAKTTEQPAPDARARRIAAARQLTKETHSIRLPEQAVKQRRQPIHLLGHLDAHSFRSVVVLSEILRPPVALREDWPEAF